MTTSRRAEPGTSTPSQKLAVANKHGVALVAKSVEQRLLRSVTLNEPLVVELVTDAFREHAHHAERRRKNEGASLRHSDELEDLFGGGVREVRRARVGQVRRRIERGLLLEAEGRLDDLFADFGFDAEAAFDELEVAAGGQRRAGEHHAGDSFVQALAQ